MRVLRLVRLFLWDHPLFWVMLGIPFVSHLSVLPMTANRTIRWIICEAIAERYRPMAMPDSTGFTRRAKFLKSPAGHARRKFHDLFEAQASPVAREALDRIAALYGIEKEIRGRPPDQRQQIRNTSARPPLDSMKARFEASLIKLSRKSELTQAIHYALGRWTQLTRYCDDGCIEIDNNAERALRAVALGRNYLFAGSDAGGERAAAMYSLIGSAKLNGLDPEAYLSNVLARIASHPIQRIEELLPWNVDLTRSAFAVAS